MSVLLEELSREVLPREITEAFVEWCVWEQGRGAFVIVLERTGLYHVAEKIRSAANKTALQAIVDDSVSLINSARRRTGPLGISAAEAAAFEYTNLLKAASEAEWDPESVAFFAARVCGWAGWADSDFSQPALKNQAEQTARGEQESYLQILWQDFSPTNS